MVIKSIHSRQFFIDRIETILMDFFHYFIKVFYKIFRKKKVKVVMVRYRSNMQKPEIINLHRYLLIVLGR
jgi:hypothetical protein